MSLKKRLETAAQPRPAREGAGGAERAGGRFVEIPLRGVPASPACVLEVEDGRGARLRLEFRDIGAGEVAGVVQSVWSERR